MSREDAVSSLVGALILLAIFVGFIAMLQVHSVPVWNREVEYAHMEILYDDFSNLKVAVEDSTIYNLPKSTAIHMGTTYPSRAILRNPQRYSSGTLTISNETRVNISYGGNTTVIQTSSLHFSPNHLYADTPTLVYEYGMVIRSYRNTNLTTDEQTLIRDGTVTIPVILSGENLTSISGADIKTVNLNPADEALPIIINPAAGVNTTFTTRYPDAWKRLLAGVNNTSISGDTVFINVTGIKEIRYPANATGSGLYAGLIRISPESTAKTVRLYPVAINDHTNGSDYWLDPEEMTKFRYNDTIKYETRGNWSNTSDPTKYINYSFSPTIPEEARIVNVTYWSRYEKRNMTGSFAGSVNDSITVYNSSSSMVFDIKGEGVYEISRGLEACLRDWDDVDSMKMKFYLDKPTIIRTQHDLTYIEIIYI
jgi:hypothetical protein